MNCKGECSGPGRYNKLVTIQKIKTGATANTSTGKIDKSLDSNWTTHANAYCSVSTGAGREFYRASQVHADLTHLWETRSTVSLRSTTPEMRIQWDGRTFEIISSMDKDEARETHQITTKEVV
jgi:SPP1 family predicted phage head-tail adaptor